MQKSIAQSGTDGQVFFNESYFECCENGFSQVKSLLQDVKRQLHEMEIYQYDSIVHQLEILMNPKYYPLTNSDAVAKMIQTDGQSLINGFQTFLTDSKKGVLPKLTQIDAFHLGENLATTKGNVIYQNELMQIIHYIPKCRKVHAVPLLVIPPWINKYYIFDLSEKKSFIKYALENGIDVYVISWKNPDEDDRHLTLKCYIKKGIETAIDIIKKDVHVLGFCLGGVATLLAGIRNKNKKIKSMTLLATPVDFSKMLELQSFIQQIDMKSYKDKILKQGYKCGKDLLRMFCLLRSEIMILNNMVNQYYLDEKPKPNDFLYWNMDSTNLPAIMHLEYIEKFFHKNMLYKGEYKIDNKIMDINKIDFPLFVVATEKDHIVPMESAFALYDYNLDIKYVLGDSGHIAGIINPPDAQKYSYKVYDRNGRFLYEKKYSWWQEWLKWIKPKMGNKVSILGDEIILEAAPGAYASHQPALTIYN